MYDVSVQTFYKFGKELTELGPAYLSIEIIYRI